MAAPRTIRKFLPSLTVEGDETATVEIADIKALLPSLKIHDSTISMSLVDLRLLLKAALAGVHVEEKWYLQQVPELRRDISQGKFSSAAEHYKVHGYLEGRLPERPTVDEQYYLKAYPDVATAIRTGRVKAHSIIMSKTAILREGCRYRLIPLIEIGRKLWGCFTDKNCRLYRIWGATSGKWRCRRRKSAIRPEGQEVRFSSWVTAFRDQHSCKRSPEGRLRWF